MFPPPVSVLSASLLFWRSQSARGSNASEMLSVTHSAWVPELSESRYLCTSKTRFVVLLSKLTTAESAAAEPLEINAPADV